jgi:hypothetical protein
MGDMTASAGVSCLREPGRSLAMPGVLDLVDVVVWLWSAGSVRGSTEEVPCVRSCAVVGSGGLRCAVARGVVLRFQVSVLPVWCICSWCASLPPVLPFFSPSRPLLWSAPIDSSVPRAEGKVIGLRRAIVRLAGAQISALVWPCLAQKSFHPSHR